MEVIEMPSRAFVSPHIEPVGRHCLDKPLLAEQELGVLPNGLRKDDEFLAERACGL